MLFIPIDTNASLFLKFGYFQYFDFISKPGYASFVTYKRLIQSLKTSFIALFKINTEKMKKKPLFYQNLTFEIKNALDDLWPQ